MALTDAELARIRHELGFNVLTVGAEPYISVVAVFDQVIQPFLQAGSVTTSSTTVTAATSPTPVTLVLASADGFTSGDRVVVDVDDRQEIATAQNLSGTSLTLLLQKAHTGTYPVVQEGGETIVRELLTRIRTTKTQMGESSGIGSLKRADDIEWYQAGSRTEFGILGENLKHWREELASALGIRSMWSLKLQGSRQLSVY